MKKNRSIGARNGGEKSTFQFLQEVRVALIFLFDLLFNMLAELTYELTL